MEHMEDEEEEKEGADFPQWALLEYRQMLRLVGRGSKVHFTGLSPKSAELLTSALSSTTTTSSSSTDVADFEIHTENVLTFASKSNIVITSICLLDPKASKPLSVHDASRSFSPDRQIDSDGPFAYFLLGGILGDDPPRDRTSALRAQGFPGRHLGAVQMTTDTALGVTKRVVEDGLALGLEGTEQRGPDGEKLQWVDQPELDFGGGESVSGAEILRSEMKQGLTFSSL